MANTQMYPSAFQHATLLEERRRMAFEREKIAEEHARDSSSVAPPRAEQAAVLFRSSVMWGVLYLPMLMVIAAVSYMLVHLDPGPGRVPSGDRGSPNAQFGDR